MISVIVPIYNEERELTKNLYFYEKLGPHAELIFVDGQSIDRSRMVVQHCGRVLQCARARATQMNFGAKYAEGDIFLFLHADTIISEGTLASIEMHIRKQGFLGGCLTQCIDNGSFVYRLIEAQGNIRARKRKVFYGDQGIFVKKDVFLRIGGFPLVPIMEDVIFSKQLRRLGRTVVLPDRILTSSRRWDKKGVVKTTFLYSIINILFWLRFPLKKIKLLYDNLR